MNLRGHHVVVVGGAIAGPAAALFLARAGARVTLLERAPRVEAPGAGIALMDNGLAVLDALGLGDAIARMACDIGGVRVTDGAGRTLFRPPAWVDGRRPRAYMMRRSDLNTLLQDALVAEPGIRALYDADLQRVDAHGELTFVQAGEEHTLRADLVIGADGARSRVRASGDFGARVERGRIAYARGLVGPGLAQHEEAWTSAGLFGSFPVRDGTYWYASLGAPLREALARRDIAAMRAAWQRAYAPVGVVLAELVRFEGLLVNDVVRVHCGRYASGRRVLIGDAAHAMAPNLGQGANSGLLDALVLTHALATERDVTSALSVYERRRKPKVEAVAARAASLGRVAEWTHPWLRFVRDRVVFRYLKPRDEAAPLRFACQEDPQALAALVVGR